MQGVRRKCASEQSDKLNEAVFDRTLDGLCRPIPTRSTCRILNADTSVMLSIGPLPSDAARSALVYSDLVGVSTLKSVREL